LFSVLAANPLLLTPPDVFAALYQQLMNRLAPAGATLVLADVPDVTSIPYLTAADRIVLAIAAQLNVPPTDIYSILGLSPGDYLTPGAVMKIQEMVAQQALGPLPVMCQVVLAGLPFQETPCVLRAAQIATIQAAVRAYNTVIADRARAAGAVRVGIAALVRSLAARGYEAGGKRLTTDFLGGLFSLDGVHPTNTGYAIIANEFIKAINQQADAEIPPLSIRQVAASDPLVFGLPGSKVGNQ
jgi:phospholipase/lecithinase/hemolysin